MTGQTKRKKKDAAFKKIGIVGLAVLSIPAAVAEVTATIGGGYDSNPFKLSDTNNNDEGSFVDAELRLDQPLGNGVTIDARVGHTAYNSDSEDPNRTMYSATLEYETESELFGKDVEYLFHGRVAGANRTFVSRNSGRVGVFGGVEVPDRFDQNSLELRGRMDLDVSDETTLRVQLDARDRTYEDYTSIGLSNLDYQQVYANAVWRYRPTDAHDIRFGVGAGKRNYDDREGRAVDGSTVLGSNLEFSFFNADASWKYDLTDASDIRFSYDYATREDSVGGYFDTTRHSTALRYRYRPDKENRFKASVGYTDFTYDNIAASAIISNEENLGPNDGWSSSIGYERQIFEDDDREVWLEAELEYEDFDSPNVNFVYDRSLFQIGLVFEF